ncbi:DUF262 domain-containing protein [Oerskovia enterophila]|uniref:DUF262 domain-containing protein n=1 Tax=Oerskovia enterophila TaxID=43678 RepID=A0ABX2Y9M4_9CELL|nr:DUF262 domain-containing protein [Oerskovia enterophila]OCI31646.1 hypothetical protein OERS_16270 [Oerskovia enterophila]
MKAGDEKLGSVFDGKVRYKIPIFQRPYVWKEEANWIPLWDDLAQAVSLVEAEGLGGEYDEQPREHFLGALVTQARSPVPRRVPTRQVIDGQQRLTTLQVFLASAFRVAAELGATSAASAFESLVRNKVADDTEYPQDRFKLVPLPTDRAAFEWAVRGPGDVRTPPSPHHLLVQAAQWFDETVRAWALEAELPTDRLDLLHFVVTERIKVVSVFLDSRDDPQVIFEALNYKGVPLDAADLVKNLLFQRLTLQGEGRLEQDLHESSWKPLDARNWREKVTTGRIARARVDTLLAYWLSSRRGELVSVEHLYAEFKVWLTGSPQPRAAEVITDLRRWADTMDELLARPMTDSVRQVIDRLEATNTTTPWPIVLSLFATEGVPDEQAVLGTEALDSFLMRRAICRLTPKDYNRLFGAVLRALKTADPRRAGQVVVDELAHQTADSRSWPTDGEFVEALMKDDLYNKVSRARLRALLTGIDTALATSRAEPGAPQKAKSNLTIEHVLPQAWRTHWPLPTEIDMDPEVAAAKRDIHVNQLGNLTLATGPLNSEMRHSAWLLKRRALQSHSLVRLTTASILSLPAGINSFTPEEWSSQWDETRIALRGLWLARVALIRWPRPMPAEDPRLT